MSSFIFAPISNVSTAKLTREWTRTCTLAISSGRVSCLQIIKSLVSPRVLTALGTSRAHPGHLASPSRSSQTQDRLCVVTSFATADTPNRLRQTTVYPDACLQINNAELALNDDSLSMFAATGTSALAPRVVKSDLDAAHLPANRRARGTSSGFHRRPPFRSILSSSAKSKQVASPMAKAPSSNAPSSRKESSLEKMDLVSQVERESEGIRDSGRRVVAPLRNKCVGMSSQEPLGAAGAEDRISTVPTRSMSRPVDTFR